ncbi:MAG: hypothetical protein HY397_01860 [Candidatus Doudnabacteria bacterium]|nr:hypothetical protein [Candidatus Doudnabacteria bacterium]
MGIGFLNTGVDFLLLNFLIALTGFTAGSKLSGLNVISFSVAVFHSFIWNKFWAFAGESRLSLGVLVKAGLAAGVGLVATGAAIYGANMRFAGVYFLVLLGLLLLFEIGLWLLFRLQTAQSQPALGRELGLFITVSVIGTIINSSIVGLVTHFLTPVLGLNAPAWANIAKILATGTALAWNFAGYKMLVFKK